MSINLKKFTLFLGDIIVLFLSLYLALFLRYGENFTPNIWKLHLSPFIFLYIFWILIFYIAGLYDIAAAKVSFEFYQKLLATLIICGIFSITFFYLNPTINIAPKTILFLNLLVIAILFSIWRNLFNLIIKSTAKSNAVIAGYSELAYSFAKKINSNPQLGFKIAGFAVSGGDEKIENDINFINLEENLRKFIKENNVNTLVINYQNDNAIIEKLFAYLPMGLNFISFTNFYENLFLKVPNDALSRIWFIENLTEGSKKTYDLIKRLFDIIAVIILGIASLPFIPFISAAIKIESAGPVLFRQKRTGKDGKIFKALKFRSMIAGAEKNGPQWAEKNDPRVTKAGKFLRKTRLDEIPQFLNILKGDMSLVGPRPERPEFIEILEKEIPFYKQRLLIKPGLTGWAQINFP
ncbi:MAG: sugar transferase, partial [bacterium]